MIVEDATYYDEHRGDISIWEPTPTPADVRKGGGVIFSFRLQAGELEAIRHRASFLNKGISAYIREVVVADAERPAVTWRR